MVIGFDVDNTMVDSAGIVNEIFLKSEYKKYADNFKMLPRDIYVDFVKKYLLDFKKNEKLHKGVKEVFDYLNLKGHKIIIITRRGYLEDSKVIDITLNNFKKWNLKYDKVFFEVENKGKVAKSEGVNLYVDDHVFNLDSIKKAGINALMFGNKEKDHDYDFVYSWEELLTYIKKKGY